MLNRLPEAVRTILANSTTESNEELGVEANQIMEAYLLSRKNNTPMIASASLDVDFDSPVGVAAVQAKKKPFHCFTHTRYGDRAFNCKSSQCAMRNQIQPRPGNGRAGRQ